MSLTAETQRLLTVAEVARKLGVSRVAAYRLINAGILPAYRIGPNGDTGPLRVAAHELDEWLDSRRTGSAA
jgi:excisionase family DNA binding protein